MGYLPYSGIVSSSTEGFVSALTVISSSDETHSNLGIDFVGLNTLIYEPITSSEYTTGYTITDANRNILDYRNTDIATIEHAAEVFNGIMLHRNGPYGFCSWKQIRNGEKPIVRHFRKNNTIIPYFNFLKRRTCL